MDGDMEAQRAELQRLLSSATDEKRRRIVEKALQALDLEHLDGSTVPSGYLMTMPQNGVVNLAVTEDGMGTLMNKSGVGGKKVVTSPNKNVSAGGRPMSSRQRRPSLGAALDAIPENRILKQRAYEKNVEIELESQDVSEASASSQDPRRPPSGELLNTASKNRRAWVSTGMFPQTLTIQFNQHWIFRKVQVIADGVGGVSMSCRSGSSVGERGSGAGGGGGPQGTVAMGRFSNIFIFDVKNRGPSGDVGGGSPSPQSQAAVHRPPQAGSTLCDDVWGNQLKFHFDGSGGGDFVSVLGLQVVAVPYSMDVTATSTSTITSTAGSGTSARGLGEGEGRSGSGGSAESKAVGVRRRVRNVGGGGDGGPKNLREINERK
jgi:hypothetical protein